MTSVPEYPCPPLHPGSPCHTDASFKNVVVLGEWEDMGGMKEKEEGSSPSLLTSKGLSGPAPRLGPSLGGAHLTQERDSIEGIANRGEVCAGICWAWGLEGMSGAGHSGPLWAQGGPPLGTGRLRWHLGAFRKLLLPPGLPATLPVPLGKEAGAW